LAGNLVGRHDTAIQGFGSSPPNLHPTAANGHRLKAEDDSRLAWSRTDSADQPPQTHVYTLLILAEV
jgi:hypothetical protein